MTNAAEVEDRLNAFLVSLEDWSLAVDVERGVMYDPLTYTEMEGNASFLLRKAVCDITIPSDADNGNANRYPGLFCVSNELIDLTERLNMAKRAFEYAANQTHKDGMSRNDLRTIYRLSGHPRLHPKQAWRQVILLNPLNLQSIGFSVAKETSGGQLVTQEALVSDLVNRNAFSLAQQISSQGVSHYRIHMPIAPHVRANVVWGKKYERVLQMHYASLPFLIPKGAWPEKRIRFNLPRTHQRRSDYCAHLSIALPYRDGAYVTPATQ